MGSTLLRSSSEIAKEKWQNYTGQLPESSLHYRIEAAKKIVENMGELKGAVMKIGQMLSITEDLILPKEITELFKKLQKDAPPMSENDLLSVFKKTFNSSPDEVFENFERRPFAQASIGQVHRATLKDGTPVAVKVQYPDIKQAVVHDFKNLDKIDQMLGLLFKQKPDIKTLIKEVKDVLALECDYRHELKELQEFNLLLQERQCGVRVPNAFENYSGEHILTMELMEGDSFEQTLQYPQEVKDRLGQRLYDFFHISLYEFNKVHTDPQSANYLFNQDQIILLDFGATKIFERDFITHYTNLLVALEKSDFPSYAHEMIELGFFTHEDMKTNAGRIVRRHYQMIHKLYTPYVDEGIRPLQTHNPFAMAKEFLQEIELKGRKAPHPDFFHLDRAHLGLYSKLRSWGSHIDWKSQRERSRDFFSKNLSETVGSGNIAHMTHAANLNL